MMRLRSTTSLTRQKEIGMKAGISKRLAVCAVLLGVSSASQAAYATEFDETMGSIVTEYLKIQTSLAADSTEGVAGAVKEIESSAKQLDPAKADPAHLEHYKGIPESIIAACAEFDDPEDIGSVRVAFQELSKPVSMWVSMARPEGKRVMYCSMKNAGWVQQGSEVANPYYGAEMLRCGYEVGGGR